MKEKVRIPLEEQETHVNYSPAELGKYCEIYTTVPSEMKRLESLVNKYPDFYTLIKDDQYSYTVRCPYKLTRCRKPRIMTEEQRQASSERMTAFHNNK